MFEDSLSTLRFCESVRQIPQRPLGFGSRKKAKGLHDEVRTLGAELAEIHVRPRGTLQLIDESEAIMGRFRDAMGRALERSQNLERRIGAAMQLERSQNLERRIGAA